MYSVRGVKLVHPLIANAEQEVIIQLLLVNVRCLTVQKMEHAKNVNGMVQKYLIAAALHMIV